MRPEVQASREGNTVYKLSEAESLLKKYRVTEEAESNSRLKNSTFRISPELEERVDKAVSSDLTVFNSRSELIRNLLREWTERIER